jgi:aminoglycoside phosphotransferase (APT) family kinase protein
MQAAAIEVGVGDQLLQSGHVSRAQRRKALDQLVERDGRIALQHGEAAFRAELSVDDATWARGRGWALSVALVALPYYQNTNSVIAAGSRRVIDAVLADHAHGT